MDYTTSIEEPRCVYRLPSHIAKTVPSTVHSGPPNDEAEEPQQTLFSWAEFMAEPDSRRAAEQTPARKPLHQLLTQELPDILDDLVRPLTFSIGTQRRIGAPVKHCAAVGVGVLVGSPMSD